MDLRQLEIIRAIAETGSFTAAGHKLHVSQSAISRQILLLEEELGEPLFLRVGRQVRMTPAAESLVQLGQRVFHLGPERDRGVLEGLALTKVAKPSDANFVLNTGPDDHRNPTEMSEFEDLLRDCAHHGLPMICANPDLVVIRGGVRVLCAGSLAMRYQELGGDVRSMTVVVCVVMTGTWIVLRIVPPPKSPIICGVDIASCVSPRAAEVSG